MTATLTDAAYGASVLAALRCGCGSAGPMLGVQPGQEGHRVNLFGEGENTPGRTFAITRDQPAVGRCVPCWRAKYDRQNAAGVAQRADSPAASQRAEWVGTHVKESST